MNAKDAIRSSANLSYHVLKSYISDLEDAELLRRPAAGCNHLAWQLGHLISSEVMLQKMVAPESEVKLPEGFNEAHSKENCENDSPADFLGKDAYVELYDKVRAATLATLDAYPEADLDKPGPERMQSLCPTMGDMFTLIATHPLMHAGQFVIVRRQLGKPILI